MTPPPDSQKPDDARELWQAVYALIVAIGRALLKFAHYLKRRYRLDD